MADKTTFVIAECTRAEAPSLTSLALALWPDCSFETELEHYTAAISSKNQACFMARFGEEFIGFVHVTLRTDHVEGTSSSPVAYIEGIYVKPALRKQGVAKLLLAEAESWGKSKGCSEMGSDTELLNMGSIAFHHRVGFSESARVVCFAKPIK